MDYIFIPQLNCPAISGGTEMALAYRALHVNNPHYFRAVGETSGADGTKRSGGAEAPSFEGHTHK